MLSAKPLESGGCGSPGGRVDDWVVTWGKPTVTPDVAKSASMPMFDLTMGGRFVPPYGLPGHSPYTAEQCERWEREDLIRDAIAQLQAFIEPSAALDEKQLKRLRKAAKQLRKMGGPKTEIGAATWRKLNSTNPE